MFLTPTHIASSPIDGYGVFSTTAIRKGTVVWEFHPDFDRRYTPEEVARLPDIAQQHIFKCAFLDKRKKLYFLGIDYDIFTNHSNEPNLIEDSSDSIGLADPLGTQRLIAARPIAAGEELTQDYREYDDPADIAWKFKEK